MSRHALDPSVAFGNDTESTIPWSYVSSVAVLEHGPESTSHSNNFDYFSRPVATADGTASATRNAAEQSAPRSGRHRKAGRASRTRAILGDPRFHAGATLGLMGTIFLPQLSSPSPTGTGTSINAVSIEPEAQTADAATASARPDASRPADAEHQGPKHALGEPRGTTAPQPGTITRAEAERQLEAWTRRNAKVGIPARALRAYLNAEHEMAEQQPSCKLRWNLLAGVGRIESNHGRFDGRTLGNDGMSSQKIIGIPLDGSAGVRAIYDTDGGSMDGDAVFDRAVGPMQFIPSTWEKWAEDGNRDGKADPHSIDDAAFTAANYLCGHGSRLDTEEGQRAALYGYNNSYSYGQDVISHAAQYIAGVQPLPDDINPRAKHAARIA